MKIRSTFRLDKDVKEMLRDLAKNKKVSMTKYLEGMIKSYHEAVQYCVRDVPPTIEDTQWNKHDIDRMNSRPLLTFDKNNKPTFE